MEVYRKRDEKRTESVERGRERGVDGGVTVDRKV